MPKGLVISRGPRWVYKMLTHRIYYILLNKLKGSWEGVLPKASKKEKTTFWNLIYSSNVVKSLTSKKDITSFQTFYGPVSTQPSSGVTRLKMLGS